MVQMGFISNFLNVVAISHNLSLANLGTYTFACLLLIDWNSADCHWLQSYRQTGSKDDVKAKQKPRATLCIVSPPLRQSVNSKLETLRFARRLTCAVQQ